MKLTENQRKIVNTVKRLNETSPREVAIQTHINYQTVLKEVQKLGASGDLEVKNFGSSEQPRYIVRIPKKVKR